MSDYIKDLEERVEELQSRLALYEDKIELVVTTKHHKDAVKNFLKPKGELRYIEVNVHIKVNKQKESITIASAVKTKVGTWRISIGVTDSGRTISIDDTYDRLGEPREITQFMIEKTGYKGVPFIWLNEECIDIDDEVSF